MWYCKNCNVYLEPDCVTYEEMCDTRYGGCGEEVEWRTIVNVVFKNRHSEEYSGQAYSYFAGEGLELAVGDIVEVDTKYGARKAMVAGLDIDPSTLKFPVDALKMIAKKVVEDAQEDSGI